MTELRRLSMRRPFVVAVACLLLLACSSGPAGPDLAVAPDLTGEFISEDAGVPDAWEPEVRIPDEVALDLNLDFGFEIPGPACEAGEGCFLDPCAENADCLSGWCVEHMGESVCSETCQEECPQGWGCKQVGAGGPDVVFVCVSEFSNLCKPCTSADGCKAPGGAEDVCVSYGAGENFCGGGCESGADCPWGFSCLTAATVDGIETTQCVADAGECPCTAASAALSLWTGCEVENEWGVCTGMRVCAAEGLSPCDAAVPAEEQCNGIDDDCDGDVDEPLEVGGDYVNLCNDDNGCTQDICNGEEGCEYVALDEGECIDGNPCTVADHCANGVCVGDPVECDDENPCTDNICTETGGCEYPPQPGGCDDGDPCTLGDHCDAGECHGEAVACDCSVDADCLEFDDGDLCTGILTCDTGQIPHKCVVVEGSVVECDEPDGADAVCLKPWCDPQTGWCSFLPFHEGYPCEDGDLCSLADTCADGVCTAGPGVNCNDGNLCTDDDCAPETGCFFSTNTLPCNDGNACTTSDSCQEEQCLGGPPLLCDDGNVCNGTEGCDPGTGCTFGEPLVCDDGDQCNGFEVCDPEEGCLPGLAPDCDDGNPCTADSCGDQGACLHVPAEGNCDDGNACTEGDHCELGQCTFAGLTDCWDENPCTDDACSPDTGCAYTLNSDPCDDEDVCTTGDHCHLGECISSGALLCDDFNTCTDDACDPDVGCQFIPNAGECDDGNACTEGDHCTGGACLVTGMLDCEDGNFCTSDSCDPAEGCLHTANTLPCSDDNICTTGDVCGGGACAGIGELSCDDENPCTDDSCDPGTGCLHVDNAAGCTDDNECTTGDHCAGGECLTTGLLECDDANICTNDNCDPAVGCVYSANNQPCDDDNVCTDGDECGQGECLPGEEVVCPDDGNECTVEGCDPAQGCGAEILSDCCGNGVVDPGEQCDDGNLNNNDSCSTDCIQLVLDVLVPGNTEAVVENFGLKVRCVEWQGDTCIDAQVLVPSATCPAYINKDLWHISVYGNDSEKRNCPNWCALATNGNTGWSTCQQGNGQVPGSYRSCAYSTTTHCQADDYTWKTEYAEQNGNLHIRLGDCYPSYEKLRVSCDGW